MAYCTMCGNLLPEGETKCSLCDVQLPPVSQPDSFENVIPLLENLEQVNPLPDLQEKASIKIGDARIEVRMLMIVIAALEIILFFLPYLKITCNSVTINFSGLDLTLGKDLGDSRSDAYALTILLLMIPLGMLFYFLSQKQLSFRNKNVFLTSTGLSIAGFIGLIILSLFLQKKLEKEGISSIASFTIWYYLALVLYLGSTIISIASILTANKIANEDQAPPAQTPDLP